MAAPLRGDAEPLSSSSRGSLNDKESGQKVWREKGEILRFA
jgi:hypothetical protein